MADRHDQNPERRDTIVVKEGGSGAGLILGVIVLIVVLAGAWYLLMGPGANATDSPSDLNVDIQLPSLPPDSAPDPE